MGRGQRIEAGLVEAFGGGFRVSEVAGPYALGVLQQVEQLCGVGIGEVAGPEALDLGYLTFNSSAPALALLFSLNNGEAGIKRQLVVYYKARHLMKCLIKQIHLNLSSKLVLCNPTDDKFTRTELAEVQSQLRLLQQSFTTAALPEAARQKLIELTQTAAVKAEGLTKKDWQNRLIGGFISAIASCALNPTQAGEVLKLVKAAFGGLFLH